VRRKLGVALNRNRALISRHNQVKSIFELFEWGSSNFYVRMNFEVGLSGQAGFVYQDSLLVATYHAG